MFFMSLVCRFVCHRLRGTLVGSAVQCAVVSAIRPESSVRQPSCTDTRALPSEHTAQEHCVQSNVMCLLVENVSKIS